MRDDAELRTQRRASVLLTGERISVENISTVDLGFDDFHFGLRARPCFDETSESPVLEYALLLDPTQRFFQHLAITEIRPAYRKKACWNVYRTFRIVQVELYGGLRLTQRTAKHVRPLASPQILYERCLQDKRERMWSNDVVCLQRPLQDRVEELAKSLEALGWRRLQVMISDPLENSSLLTYQGHQMYRVSPDRQKFVLQARQLLLQSIELLHTSHASLDILSELQQRFTILFMLTGEVLYFLFKL